MVCICSPKKGGDSPCVDCYLGGNWGVRIIGKTETPETLTNIYFYAGLEGLGEIHLANEFHDDVFREKRPSESNVGSGRQRPSRRNNSLP
jgi:hypothetical protein